MRRRPNDALVRVVVLAATGVTLATIFLGCSRDGAGGETLRGVTPQPTPAATPRGTDGLSEELPNTGDTARAEPYASDGRAIERLAHGRPQSPSEGTLSARTPDGL